MNEADAMATAPSFLRLTAHVMRLLIMGTLMVTLIGFAGRWHWYADLFNHLRPQYAVVFLLTLGMSLGARRWRWAVLSLVGLALNAFVLAPHAIPYPSHCTTPDGEPILHIATINLLVSNPEHDAVVKLLRDRLPDIVVFQEAAEPWVKTLESLKDVYPHQRIEFHARSFFGLAILSRLPWRSAELVKLGVKSDAFGLSTQFDWCGRSVSLMDMHGYHPTLAEKMVHRRLMQDSMIRWSSEKQQAGDAVIIAGDFNCTPWSFLFQDFVKISGLIDSSQGRIFEATRNVWYPNRLLIDHAFVSRDWQVAKREVGPEIGSDHRPVFVDLALTQTPVVTSSSAAPVSHRR